jgi:AraC family transcriptional regulator of adaptative response / DNA-3-methyladenine glycosylase II
MVYLSAMPLDHDTCYRALCARDRRFDGRFYTGVTSTGVYCRPICPAHTPRRENCTFFACAAAAEAAGFRPCRRCRPETSPGTPAWAGTCATVDRALRLIEEGALDGGAAAGGRSGGVVALAARLGVGDRHLRRLFLAQLGASPLAVALTRRTHLARRLLQETDLPATQVALAAGFGSIRRFNSAIRRTFGMAPTDLRHRSPTTGPPPRQVESGNLTIRLAARPPLGWDQVLAYLRPRAVPGVESIRGATYRRLVALDGGIGMVSLAAAPGGDGLLLTGPAAAALHLVDLTRRARRLADLDAEPEAVARQLRSDPLLRARLEAGAVCRLVGGWDRFELAVRVILGQQVSVPTATLLAGRLVRSFGHAIIPDRRDGGLTHLFPNPAELAAARTAEIAACVGIPTARAAAIQGLAAAVDGGAPVLTTARSLEETIAGLMALPGIGPWTAHLIALRALQEPDALPAGDLGLRRALGLSPPQPGSSVAGHGESRSAPSLAPTPASAREVASRAESWRPWRGYGAFLIWAPAVRRRQNNDG